MLHSNTETEKNQNIFNMFCHFHELSETFYTHNKKKKWTGQEKKEKDAMFEFLKIEIKFAV